MPWFRKHDPSVTVVAAPSERRRFFPFGRRYLANAPYMLPSDEQEISGLDFQRYMLRYALRGNYAAPMQIRTRSSTRGAGSGAGQLRWLRSFPRPT